jgi:hypothetical protein
MVSDRAGIFRLICPSTGSDPERSPSGMNASVMDERSFSGRERKVTTLTDQRQSEAKIDRAGLVRRRPHSAGQSSVLSVSLRKDSDARVDQRVISRLIQIS